MIIRFLKQAYKSLIVLVYLFLALFILPSDISSCEEIVHGNQFYVSADKSKAALINNQCDDCYFIIQNRNRSEEITNSSNKNDNFLIGSFDKSGIDYGIPIGSIVKNTAYPAYTANNVTKNLKNVIYTRAP